MPWLVALLVTLAAPALGDVYIWVDDAGKTVITDDPDAVPREQRERLVSEGAALSRIWDQRRALPAPIRNGSGAGEDRVARLLRGAVGDLERGNAARAAAALDTVLRLAPGNPEAHWLLALLEQQRGHLDSAAVHLEAFLAQAGDSLEAWRESARRRLAALADERRLSDPAGGEGPLRLVGLEGPHFRLHYDARLGAGSPAFAPRVARYLEEARDHVTRRLGVTPSEPIGVVLYGKAAYVRAHAHRFSFETVGFFDGRIHVVSAAHPAGELRALLFHEYAHAVFRERTGGDRPFWLNEGLAELAESSSRRVRPLRRERLVALRARIEAGAWIPLRRLAAGFSGLSDTEARTAYLEATAAAHWLERQTDAAARARLLEQLGAGASEDAALRAAVSRDTEGIDAAVRAAVLAEFPPAPVPEPPGEG